LAEEGEDWVESRKFWIAGTHDRSDKSLKVPKDELSKDKSAYANRKVILLLRDPKDIVVSAYLHATKNKGSYTGELSSYIHDHRYGVEKIVQFYNNWYGNEGIAIWYEDLVKLPHKVLTQVLCFIDAPFIHEDVIRAVRLCSLDNMKVWEREGTHINKVKHPEDPESYYHRKGVPGDHVNYMSDEDIEFCDHAIKEMKCQRKRSTS
jgi:hypothetical protein